MHCMEVKQKGRACCLRLHMRRLLGMPDERLRFYICCTRACNSRVEITSQESGRRAPVDALDGQRRAVTITDNATADGQRAASLHVDG